MFVLKAGVLFTLIPRPARLTLKKVKPGVDHAPMLPPSRKLNVTASFLNVAVWLLWVPHVLF